MSITTDIALYEGFAASVNNGSITDALAQANFAGDYLRQIFDNRDGFAYGMQGKTGSILMNVIDSDKAGITREFNQGRFVNTSLDPEVDTGDNNVSKRRNVNSQSQLGNANIRYRSNLDLATDLPTFEDSFVLTQPFAVKKEQIARKIQEAELMNSDLKNIFNVVGRTMEDINVSQAKAIDKGILDGIFHSFNIIDGETQQNSGSTIGINSLSASHQVVRAKQKSLWRSTFETALLANGKGLDYEGLRRLSLTLSNFEFRNNRPVILLPNEVISNLFKDTSVINSYGYQVIAQQLLDGKIYVPYSEGHMYYKMSSLPFDMIGFNSMYDSYFYGQTVVSASEATAAGVTAGTYDHINAIMLNPMTFELGYFNDPITKKYGDTIVERKPATTTSLMDDLYIRKIDQFELMLKNPHLSKTFKIGVSA